MRTAVGQPENGCIVHHLVVQCVVVAVGIVEERQQQHGRLIGCGECVVRNLHRRCSTGLRQCAERTRGILFVVGLDAALQHVAARENHLETLLTEHLRLVVIHGLLRKNRGAYLRVAHGNDALVHREVGDGLVRRPQPERVAGLQTEQHAERAAGDERHHFGTLCAPLGCCVHLATPPQRVLVVLQHDERGRETGLLCHGADPVEFPFGDRIVIVGNDAGHRDLEDATATITDGLRDGEELVVVGKRAGHGDSVAAEVTERARRGETERTGLHGLACESGHLGDIRRCGLLVAPTALVAHHVCPERSVRKLDAHVHGPLPLAEDVHVLGETLPPPRHSLVEGRAGNVLDALHQPDEMVLTPLADGCEPDTAVAGDDGGDAVRCRRIQFAVPRHLAVVVGVDVDEAGRDDATRGVDFLPGLADDGG